MFISFYNHKINNNNLQSMVKLEVCFNLAFVVVVVFVVWK